jgi:hypothetical protein
MVPDDEQGVFASGLPCHGFTMRFLEQSMDQHENVQITVAVPIAVRKAIERRARDENRSLSNCCANIIMTAVKPERDRTEAAA